MHSIKNAHPELEGQLKLLYTAVTRCISRLIFAETSSSISSQAFARWLLEKRDDRGSLATKQNVDDVEKMKYTPDEWRSLGIDRAVLAESTGDPEFAVNHWIVRCIVLNSWGTTIFVVWHGRIVRVPASDPNWNQSRARRKTR
jgi:hypothetical protein